MSRRRSSAFTLVEMLMVMVIIGVIASLIVGVAGYVNKRGARSRAQGEINAMAMACEKFRSDEDNKDYPREPGTTEQMEDGDTSPINPLLHGDPQSSAYRASSLFLYKALSGDANADGRGGDDGQDGKPLKTYMTFSKGMLGKNAAGTVAYIQDPFGNSYGYSTSRSRAEKAYTQKARSALRTDNAQAGEERAVDTEGYNTTFDLWSTGGTNTSAPTDAGRNKWEKNW